MALHSIHPIIYSFQWLTCAVAMLIGPQYLPNQPLPYYPSNCVYNTITLRKGPWANSSSSVTTVAGCAALCTKLDCKCFDFMCNNHESANCTLSTMYWAGVASLSLSRARALSPVLSIPHGHSDCIRSPSHMHTRTHTYTHTHTFPSCNFTAKRFVSNHPAGQSCKDGNACILRRRQHHCRLPFPMRADLPSTAPDAAWQRLSSIQLWCWRDHDATESGRAVLEPLCV